MPIMLNGCGENTEEVRAQKLKNTADMGNKARKLAMDEKRKSF